MAGDGTPHPTGQLILSLLLPEILGFSPQLLLNDITDAANDAVTTAVNDIDPFITRWAEERAKKEGGDWDSTQDIEQGLVSFQTLLEYHTNIAFDFFEAWSLRNIFAIPPDLPIVMPHHRGLDLTQTPEREKELMDETEDLRKKIENQRRLRRTYMSAIQKSNHQRRRAEQRLKRVSFLDSPSMDVFATIPSKLIAMHSAVSSLPPLDPSVVAALTQLQLMDPGKRLWETSQAGYLQWVVGQLLATVRQGSSGSKTDAADPMVNDIGKAEDLRRAMEEYKDVEQRVDG